MPKLTQERAKEVLNLDVNTGVLTWRMKLSNRIRVGSVAGCVDNRCGYILVRIDGVLYMAHNIIWLMLYGEWRGSEIDHIDRNTANNVPSNLRIATQGQQVQNKSMQSNNTSGYRGVTWCKREQKWIAQVQFKRKNHVLGKFEGKELAAEAARKKRIELFGQYAPSYDLAAPI